MLSTPMRDFIITTGWRSVDRAPEEPVVFVKDEDDFIVEFSLNEAELTQFIGVLKVAMEEAKQDFLTRK
jgi:hypothetical protein